MPPASTVSVLIPCHNAAPFLGEALESVFAQTRPAQEVIVVDDGSTDGSADVARRFRGVTVLCLPKNRGQAHARNLAVAAATGDVLAMLDADDRWEPGHLASLVRLLERYPEAAVASAHAEAFGAPAEADGAAGGSRSGLWECRVPVGPPADMFWPAFESWIVPHNACVVRADALRAVGGYDEHERVGVDHAVMLRLAWRWPFVATGERTAWWRRHPGQLSARRDHQLLALARHRARFIAEVAGVAPPGLVAEMRRRAARFWWKDVIAARRFPGRAASALRPADAYHAPTSFELARALGPALWQKAAARTRRPARAARSALRPSVDPAHAAALP